MGKRWLKGLPAAAIAWILTAVFAVTAFADGALIPVGETVGIQIEMEGVLVAGVTDVETDAGTASPAGDAGIQAGDMIVALDGKAVESAAELIGAIEALDGTSAQVTVRRGGPPPGRRAAACGWAFGSGTAWPVSAR